MKASLLKDQEIQSINEHLTDWNLSNKKLVRQFTFSNFIEAFAFMTKVAIISEGMNHHPELSNVYSKLSLKVIILPNNSIAY